MENTFPNKFHFFLFGVKSNSIVAAGLDAEGSGIDNDAEKESKPITSPAFVPGTSKRWIVNRLPGVGRLGADDGGDLPLLSASCLSQR
jgi:hypothetical protein